MTIISLQLKDLTHKITRLINRVIYSKPKNLVLEERIEEILIQFKKEIKKEILLEFKQQFKKEKK